ncbi:MAG: VCBS repeat-containing protein [Acidobacteria bacterium]|nr:VCBS repeat-containing protein [Acidobacteriota bacterium]
MISKISLAVLGVALAAGGFFAAPQAPAPSAAAARMNNLGVAYMNQQNFEKGFKAFQSAATLDPTLQVARLNEGIALLGQGKVDDAKPLLEEAVKRDPNQLHAWYNLGLLYKNSANPEAAVDAFRRVTTADPSDPTAWYFLGAVYAQIKQFPQAIDAFQHALKLDPLHASAEFGLSRAWQQSGDTAQARQHLQRFQYITQNKLGSPMGLAYGDQGKYSLAEESPGAVEKALPPIAVKFVDVSKQAGLASIADAGAAGDLASYLGSGACFLDYDGDDRLDIFLPDNGPQGGMGLLHNLGGGKLEDVTKKAGLDPSLHAIGCTAGDFDNDGLTDLAVSLNGRVLLLHNEKNGVFKDVGESAGLKSDGFNLGVSFVDYDHDGDLDLYITRFVNAPAPAPGKPMVLPLDQLHGADALFRNNGNGTFTEVTQEAGFDKTGPSVAAVGTDANNDRAIDLLVTGPATQVYENPREGKFLARAPWTPNPALQAAGATVLDFDHDGWMDLAFTHWDSRGLTLWRNNRGKTFEAVALPKPNWVRGWSVAAFDYDNDGWVDLVATGETAAGKGEVRLFRNLGRDGFQDVTAEVGLDQIALQDPRAVVVGDFDNDGAVDLLVSQNHGPAVLLRNEGGNQNHWLRLNLKGLNDNKSAIGVKVEVFTGAIRQKFEIAGSSGYLGQNSTQLTIGLGQAKDADIVRMLWPGGVLQDEAEVAGLQQQDFTQLDRRGSSCPTLFVWNGEKYELVADVLGAGVIGHWVAPGERNIARPTEYVKVPRDRVGEKDGKLSFRLMEPMEEVVYLDHVKLLAVDHPADLEVHPNEYFASNPPYPEFKVVFSRGSRPPAGAWDEHGHDVLPDLLAQRYFGDFALEPFKGFTKPHTLELDLGEAYRGGPLWLLMHGEIEYFTATGMYAASQAGIQGIAPYVEALHPGGQWVRVLEDMGFPAGGPRTITVDLTNKVPRGARRVRITTNLQVYWNSILVSRTPQIQPARLTAVPMAVADLRFHGYPRQVELYPPGNVQYHYEQVSRTGPYARQAGAYTRYGDVRTLLAGFDDKLAVFGSGEEVALEFDPSGLPALPQGWVRDYFFAADGYEKDMDFYAAHGDTVEPLPFRDMGTYPNLRSFPLDDSHLDYMLKFNTRHVSGNEPQGYGYEYSPQ